MTIVYGGDKELDDRLEKALGDTRLTVTLQGSRRHLLGFRADVEERHPDWAQRVDRARAIRTDAVARAPELLDRFEQAVTSRGGRVVRAANADDAVRVILEIAQRRGVKLIAKGKSMISEELELNHALEAAGLTPVETDLGEWIVQLAGERPSHLLAPAIHRSRGQIAEVLAADRGGPMSDDPQQLVAYSRDRLRSTFLEAGMGITGANFMVAESGTVIVLENEGNGRLVSSLPRCHVMLAGLERVLETTADAAFMIEQLALAAVGRELPSYVSWLSGPADEGDDGPEEFVVIVLDNGRSRIRESDESEILNCIRCGSCLTVCPVYSKVGGHAYGSVYGGPIGAVLTPLLTDFKEDEGRKLPFLSSLCGACTDACPVGIPLHDLLVRDRTLANRSGLASRGERAAWGAWSRAWASPRLYRASAKAGARSGPFARAFGPGASWLDGRATLPLPSTKPFHRRWRDLDDGT
ncbi:MAG: L-lactate dehydrogenase complex protein LldF [Gaiellales bacterium]|nr:L-lactate dehydrogenase complex protein LldF [Gaiellales bacterium]